MATYNPGTGVGSGYAHGGDTVDKMTQLFSTSQLTRSAVLLLTFIFAVVNRKLWFGVDLIANGLFALAWFLFPQALLGFQVNSVERNQKDVRQHPAGFTARIAKDPVLIIAFSFRCSLKANSHVEELQV